MSTRRSLRQQKKQTRLSFQPLASSSPTKESYSTAVQDRLANVRFQGSDTQSRRSKRNVTTEEPFLLPTPEPSSQPHIANDNESPQSSDTHFTPQRFGSQHEAGKPSDGEDQTDEDDVVVPSSKRRRVSTIVETVTPTRKSARLHEIDTPRSNLSLRSRQKHVRTASSPPTNRAISIGSAETSGDEDANLFTQPTKRRRAASKHQTDDPFIVSDDNDADLGAARRSTSRVRKKSTPANDFVVDDDDEIEYISSDKDEPILSTRRRQSKSRRRERSRKVQDELDDDLKDLQDSDNSEVVGSNRTRGGPVNTQRDRNREHFELLKRRRAGEPVPRITSSDDGVDPGFDDEDGVDIDHVANGALSPGIRFRSRSTESEVRDEKDEEESRDNEVFIDDDEEDDFIVEDDSQPFREIRTGIPLAFTSFASQKPRELFIHIIEWLVKNKIAPAFSRDDELYRLAWNKINDQIKAQAGSRLISAAWNEDFKYAILARPQMEVHLVNEGNDEFFLNCDACNRTNHPARYEFKFLGHAYHNDTLEPIDESEDEESNDGEDVDDGASYDQQGHLLPSAHRTYNLGRFCAANAEMGHKLTHWKYHLNQSLLAYLEEQGVLSAEAIVAREKLNKKRREREAETIVDQMQETGMIDEMWRGLQDDLEDARYGMEDHVSKSGRRNNQRIGNVRGSRGNGGIEDRNNGGNMRLVMHSDSE